MEFEWSSSELDFTFAFNDANFSDRLLRIEIMPNSVSVTTIADLTTLLDKQVLNDSVDAPPPNSDTATVAISKKLHVNSAILAAKSPFFYKLFSNGMMESQQRHATLRINASEEDALMELLSFMYTNTLNITAAPGVFDVLIAAEKFQVPSCIRYCSNWLLRNSPSTLLCLKQLSYTDVFQPLIDAAKQCLVDQYNDITKLQEEVMALPLSGIEVILASDDLQVESEDVVYDFVLKWARQHYNNQDQEERREVMGTRLGPLIRFPFMTNQKLKEVLTCDCDFKQLVLEALIFKAKALHLQRQQLLAAEELNHHRFVGRAYNYMYHPVKVVEFEFPLQQCVVYFNLKREECATLFPSGRLYSQTFHLGGQGFFLSAECNIDELEDDLCFGLFLGMQENSSESLTVEYQFAARSKTMEDKFAFQQYGIFTFIGGKVVGDKNLFIESWDSFIAEDSRFFINDVLYLRASLTIQHD
ncbi:BTB/POZ domain-containing protein At2g46260-like [Lotus japonicus]|uniref:BTB/POZ domain-containing protein At2g46260-like n=1 Tax=Lotus japonicus TaxID=34305 RepID=UPI00258B115A|nr:BTB/POZ domain-containing protein At2g46260-like [Lotus japonicus]